jgi:hypothetical protein
MGRSGTRREKDEPEEGFEPSAPALQERCSDQLSYSGARPMLVAVHYETQGSRRSRRA